MTQLSPVDEKPSEQVDKHETACFKTAAMFMCSCVSCCSVLNKTGTSQQVPETLRAPLSTLHALWMFDVYMPIDCHKCISVTARVCASGVHVSYLCASSSPGLTVPAPCCPGTPWPPGYLVSLKPSVVKISSTCKAPAIGGGSFCGIFY